jgi:hypothetical protein
MVLSAFWQPCVSGRASGCQKSCKWFASGDFYNHLQINLPLENRGPWPGSSDIRTLRVLETHPRIHLIFLINPQRRNLFVLTTT